MRKSLGDLGDKIDSGDKSKIESAIKELEETIKGDDVEAIKSGTQALAEASHRLAEEMYKAASAGQGEETATQAESSAGSQAGDENVVDAEFEEVKDDDKK